MKEPDVVKVVDVTIKGYFLRKMITETFENLQRFRDC